MDPEVTVRLQSGNASAEWEARLERLREELDTQTRTLGIVVVVDKPYEKMIPGRRPPLVRGCTAKSSYAEKVRKGRVVIPRSTLHEGHVFVLDLNNRLRRREVDVDFTQDDFVVFDPD